MVYLNDIMDPLLLNQHVKNGLVSRRFHESLPLAILNYTPECQYSRAWDSVTKQCRGLIYNTQTMEVVARPFEKFFNWDESGSPFPPSGPALRMEKMDGSLGILYPTGEHFSIATRGSFHSEQAEWATDYYNKWHSEAVKEFYRNNRPYFLSRTDKTYLFEIIYPENRIVVDYGEYEGLTLIDVIDNETGFSDTDEFDNCAWPDKVRRVPVAGFDSGQCNDIPEGDEGFVYLWPTRNFRTKMKSAQYVYLHRLVSNLNEKTIWEMLVAGKTLDDIKKELPEEFHGFVDEKGGEILKRANDTLLEAYEVYDSLAGFETRKDFATEVMAHHKHLSKYLFALLDFKSIWALCLKDAKPVKVSKTAADKEAA